jgi:Xaa-Pro dipeptidase
MELDRIQQELLADQLDGWLLYDFRKSNPIAYQVLGLPEEAMYTRRWFYFIPAAGSPTAVISAVEAHVLAMLPGKHLVFRTWQEMQEHLRTFLRAGMRVAMEYSPLNAIPYVSRVDAGTVELIRSYGVEVASSADIAQRFMARLSQEQMDGHREAGQRLMAAKNLLFAQIGEELRLGVELDEYRIQQRFAELLKLQGVVAEEPPLVAVNANASNPHYSPSSSRHSQIRRGDLVLFDFWGHLPGHDAIYADYTWMAFAGTEEEIPEEQRNIFEIVRRARDTGIAFIRERLAAGKAVRGCEADDATRAIISAAGYADYFVHRTGHNIGTEEHGSGANVDNYETQDERILLAYTCCSIEPGIYLPAFGMRSEVDLLILEGDAEVTGGEVQQRIVPLLA